MDVVGLIAGSGWASGLNLYLVTLILGLSGRLGWSDVPEVLTRTDVLVIAGILFFVEFAADKIPYLDNLWDALHTVIRPLGAAALGYVIAGDSESIGEAVGALVAGALALSSHSAKASTRAAANTSPEPLSNLTLSVFEDGVAASVVALALAFPIVALGVVVVLAIASVWVVWRLWSAFRRFLSRLRRRKDRPPD
ncbi:MAG TPA: DUF4126 domain-containing protein [Acidimicrobiia bacterium]|nr:DUF4126 domain-containing protein [Acidimicrobiia bacterium]